MIAPGLRKRRTFLGQFSRRKRWAPSPKKEWEKKAHREPAIEGVAYTPPGQLVITSNWYFRIA